MCFRATRWARKEKTGSVYNKIVLLVLAEAADKKGECFLSQREIANRAECSMRKVRDALNKLEAWGLLYRKPRKRKGGSRSTDMISLSFHRVATTKQSGIPCPQTTETEQHAVPGDAAHGAGGSGTACRVCINSHSNSQSERESLSQQVEVWEELPTELPSGWREWARYHYAVTDADIDRVFRKCHRHHSTLVAQRRTSPQRERTAGSKRGEDVLPTRLLGFAARPAAQ
jgi:hypothetical protein